MLYSSMLYGYYVDVSTVQVYCMIHTRYASDVRGRMILITESSVDEYDIMLIALPLKQSYSWIASCRLVKRGRLVI
jgi:hypothetical protein